METILYLCFYCGAIICILFAFLDFKSHIPAYQKNIYWNYTVSVLFVFVVLLIYAGLCYIMVGIKIVEQFPFIGVIEKTATLESVRPIAPLILSLMYFSATKSTLKIMGKEICLYNRLLQVFIGFISHRLNSEEITGFIDKENEIKSFQNFLKHSIEKKDHLQLEIPPGNHNFNAEREKVQEIAHGVALLEEIDRNGESLSLVLNRQKKTLDETQADYSEKLKKAVKDLIDLNTKNSLFTEFIFQFFRLKQPGSTPGLSEQKHPIIRTIALSLIGSIPLTIIYNVDSEFEIATLFFILAASLFAFLFWFLGLARCKWSVNGALMAILIGMVAGMCGSIIFDIFNPKTAITIKSISEVLKINDFTQVLSGLWNEIVKIDKNQLLKGLLYGGGGSGTVYFFRYLIVRRFHLLKQFKYTIFPYLLLGIIGFFLFSIGAAIAVSLQLEHFVFQEFWHRVWKPGVLGAVLSIIIAVLSDIVYLEMSVPDRAISP